MKTHFCPQEKQFVEYEHECNWCGQKEMKVLIYTKRKCPDCTAVKDFLRAKNIEYVEMDMESSPDLPHIFIDGQRVDGLAGLQEALK
jgi:glutaredoxin